MQSAREQQQGRTEVSRVVDQEFPDACLDWNADCEPQAHVDEASACTEDDKIDAPSSSVRPNRLGSQHVTPLASVCPKLLQAHLPLVHQIVKQLARRLPANVLHDDLVAAGVLGLLDSLRKNGGDGGETFEWYARTRIRGAVMDELRAQDWLKRRARAAVVKAAASEDASETRPGALVSLQELSPGEESDYLVAPSDDPVAMLETRDEYRTLQSAIEQLPEREQLIVRLHYFEDVKFKDIGVKIGVSEPRVSQLHARALCRLHVFFHETTAKRRAPAQMRRAMSVSLQNRRSSASARVA